MQKLGRTLSAKSLAQERNLIQSTTTLTSSNDSPTNSVCGFSLPNPCKKRGNTLDSKHHHELRQKTQDEPISSSPAGCHRRSESKSAIANTVHFRDFDEPPRCTTQSISNESSCSQPLQSTEKSHFIQPSRKSKPEPSPRQGIGLRKNDGSIFLIDHPAHW